MIKNKRFIKEIIAIFLCLTFLIVPKNTVQAADQEDGYGEKINFDTTTGIFTFTTVDTKASSSIKWKTVGFTVCKVPTNGYPRKDTDGDPKTKDYAIFKLSKGDVYQEEYDSTHWKVTFTFSVDKVNAAFKNTTLDEVKEGEILYFNGIFHVVYDGVEDGYDYYNLTGKPDGIATAESWANPEDFADRFDRWSLYSSGSDNKYPVTIERRIYSNASSTEYDTKDYTPQMKNTEFKTDSSKIVDKINTGDKEYYLYRVYYINLRDPKKIVGNRKTSVSPYLSPGEYASAASYLRDREYLVKDKGLKIVAMYRRFTERLPSESEDIMDRDFEIINPTATIAADTRGNEAYDVLEGIPGTESLYANAFTSKYLSGYQFINKSGTKVYPVTVTKTYILTWTETTTSTDAEGNTTTHTENKSRRVPVPRTYYIERKYSYWYIDALGVYSLDKAILENEALPGGSVTLTPSGYTAPTVSYTNSTLEADHIEEPRIVPVTVPGQTISGGSSEPSIPDENLKQDAEDKVDNIVCKNDKLIFNGQTIMSDSEVEEKTEKPLDIPEGTEEIGENVLYTPGLVVPGTMANGEFESAGTISYMPVVTISNESVMETETDYDIEDINPVVVHTPVICDATVEDNRKDNQMITPDIGRASLVLDRPFHVTLPTKGSHRDIPGYGYRDYAKYIASRQVKFAFDVYKGGSTSGSFIPKNTWSSVAENTLFYVPTWVTEGRYEIRFRSTAINAAANNGTDSIEDLANLELENYVAEDSSIVQVSGRIYGLNLYDISDYPTWQDVFRIPNSLSLTGFKYTVGDKDENGNSNGNNANYTLALMNGSHPKYSNIGAIKAGYVTRFNLQTVGNMYGDNDYVRITPTFYYVDSTGKNRQEVDIYYSETFNGKKNTMVKMGSALDLENKKSLRTGDLYLAIPEQALNQTAYYKGVTQKDWKAQLKNVFTYTNIMLPGSLRTFIGYVANVPGSVTKAAVAKSVQNWYGEYYLPSEIHVVPKGFNINEYIKNKGGLNYKENFWLKNGYIIVNFNIETIQDGERHLSYINADNAEQGYCNMWKREGYKYKKIDNKGNEFNYLDGDYVLYYTDKSAAQDYISAGTH